MIILWARKGYNLLFINNRASLEASLGFYMQDSSQQYRWEEGGKGGNVQGTCRTHNLVFSKTTYCRNQSSIVLSHSMACSFAFFFAKLHTWES